MKLYFHPKTRSTRPLWLLEELEIPYTRVKVRLRDKEHKTDEYRKIHPLGKVPALVNDDDILFESMARHGLRAPETDPRINVCWMCAQTKERNNA